MSTVPTCVLVYNPLAGHGHLDSWNAMFVSILLAQGYRIIAVTEDAGALAQRLAPSGDLRSPALQIFDLKELGPGLLDRVVDRIGREVRRLFCKSPGPGDAAITDPESSYLEPVAFAHHVRRAMKKSRWNPSLVLNMYMDLYRTDATRWQAFERARPIPWIGIRFIPKEDPTEAYYGSDSLVGMCFLDEKVVQAYRARFSSKQFYFLPDITHSELPAERTALAQEILAQAAGRKIVFMGGTIARTKNLAAWYRLIALADPQKWYFVQIGEIREDALEQEDLEALARARRLPPDNLTIHEGYLQDERVFNEIIAASDIIFAVYRDFPISSNMLGKAATFEKPILVADKHLMGARVADYGIGMAVPQDDAAVMLAALEQLAHGQRSCPGFRAYREDFGRRALARRLNDLMDRSNGGLWQREAT